MQGGDQQATEPAAELEQLIVFDVDHEEYAVPISDIKEVLEVPAITPVPDSPAFVLGVINLRGKVLPVIDLEKRLGLRREHEDTKKHIVIADHESGLIGVQVDMVKEVIKVPTKWIQPTPSMIISKISPEFLRGVVVIAKKSASAEYDGGTEAEEEQAQEVQADARILLLLELKKIISPDELAGALSSAPTVPPKQNEGEA